MVPSIALRQGYLEKVHLAQIQSEKDDILSHIGRLQPRVRDEYLRHKKRARIFNDYMTARNSRSGVTTEERREAYLRLRRIPDDVYDLDRLQSGEHAEYLQTRDAALTDRIPKKAVGL